MVAVFSQESPTGRKVLKMMIKQSGHIKASFPRLLFAVSAFLVPLSLTWW